MEVPKTHKVYTMQKKNIVNRKTVRIELKRDYWLPSQYRYARLLETIYLL